MQRHPLLARLAIVQVLASLSAGATGGLLVVLAEDRLGVGPGGFGLLLAAIGAGAAAGPLLLRRFVPPSDRRWLFSALIYPVVVHWNWGGGWLSKLSTPFHDFAGSTMVHMTGGVAALMGAIILGPRLGKYGPDGKPRAIPAHNIPYAVLGTFILLVGWYGFNPGSELAADGAIGGIAVTTTLAAAAGAIVAMVAIWMKTGKPDVAMTANPCPAATASRP